MKRLIRAFTALFALISLAWYCLPSVYRTLHAPDCTERSAVRSAPALRVAEPELQFVRSGRIAVTKSTTERLDKYLEEMERLRK